MTCTSSYPSSGSTSRLCFAMALETTAGVLSWLVNYLGKQAKKIYKTYIMWKCKCRASHRNTHIFIYQYALVEVSVAVLQADSYDACVLCLGVISWGLTRRTGGQGCEGDGPSMWAGGPREWGRYRSHGDTGCRRAGVHGVEWSTRRGFRELMKQKTKSYKQIYKTIRGSFSSTNA